VLSDPLAILEEWRTSFVHRFSPGRVVDTPASPSRAPLPDELTPAYYGSLTPAQLHQLAQFLLRILAADRRLRRAASRHNEDIA
jgi:hypothetical protein